MRKRFLSETKIDDSYPDSQFHLQGYSMYRRDRKKGGGGLMAYFSSMMPSKKLNIPTVYETLEVLAVESKIENKDFIFLGIYRPPRSKASDGIEPTILERSKRS